MPVRVLGSAVGGGVPQRNCGCEHCIAAVRDTALARTGCSAAVSADGSSWTVLNAPAELPCQLAAFRVLRPRRGTQETPFAQLVLTDAELDHALGLLMLRQAAALTVASTASVRSLLEGVLRLLGGYLAVAWREIIPGNDFPLDPFFSDGELVRSGKPRTGRQLGHLPVGGPDGSLAQLEPAIRSKVVYTHLNNTNPLLAEHSAASEQVPAATPITSSNPILRIGAGEMPKLTM